MSAGLQVHHHHHHHLDHHNRQHHYHYRQYVSIITFHHHHHHHHHLPSSPYHQLFGSADVGEAGLCLYTLGAIPLFVLCKPMVLYKTLLAESEWWQGLSIDTTATSMGRDEGSSSNSSGRNGRNRPGERASLGRGSSWFPSGVYVWKVVCGEVMQRRRMMMSWIGISSSSSSNSSRLKPIKHYEGGSSSSSASSREEEGRGGSSPNDHLMGRENRIAALSSSSLPSSSSSSSLSASGFEQLQGPLLGSVQAVLMMMMMMIMVMMMMISRILVCIIITIIIIILICVGIEVGFSHAQELAQAVDNINSEGECLLLHYLTPICCTITVRCDY